MNIHIEFIVAQFSQMTKVKYSIYTYIYVYIGRYIHIVCADIKIKNLIMHH